MKNITEQQWQILKFILNFRQTHGYSPSVREITRGCSLNSSSITQHRIDDLCHLGYVHRKPGISRSLILTISGLNIVPLELEISSNKVRDNRY
jgi:SOS-response transcriptional repressor LexA